jgi:hypothetical protein
MVKMNNRVKKQVEKRRVVNRFSGASKELIEANYFLVQYPEMLDSAFRLAERLKKRRRNRVELVLRQFEDESREILTEGGHTTDLKKLNQLEKARSLNLPSRIAKQVLSLAASVRDSISRKDIEGATIGMMKLTLKATHVNLYTLVRRGIRTKSAASRGGKGKKRIEALVLALIPLIQTRKQKSARTLWDYLAKKHDGEENALGDGNSRIWVYDNSGTNLLFVDDGFGEKSVAFSTFKRYVAEAKKRFASL